MKESKDVLEFINWIKSGLLKNPGKFNDEYQQGYYNALEMVAAFMEKRPELPRDINKQAKKFDMEQHPEYFL